MAKSADKAQQDNVKQLRKQIENLSQRLEMADLIFNHIHSGACVTDAKGFITHFNEPYGNFVGVEAKKQIGRHITDVIENTRMHIVAQTGKAELNASQRISGKNMLVQRIPIFKDRELIAVFGHVIFTDVREMSRLAHRLSLLESKVQLYEEELKTLRSTRYTMDSIKGASPAITALKREALRAASNQLPVLISGESGTGKELFAQGIHQASPRNLRPFVRLNCAAIPKDLFESEFFGYAKGAFTGARSQGKPGKFELANGGTIFLDEIGELPLEMQPKLLRVLEEKEFERLGGTKIIRTDFKLIAATNRNLEKMMEKELFREDLYYRLKVISIQIPSLRDRREDIPPLTHMFVQNYCELHQMDKRLRREVMDALAQYDYPGNIRELKNLLESMIVMSEDPAISLADVPAELRQGSVGPHGTAFPETGFKQAVREFELNLIKNAVSRYGSVSDAAQALGVHPATFWRKLADENRT